MNGKNKNFNVELHVNLKTYLNDFKNLFLISGAKEIENKNYIFTKKEKELYIISYENENKKEKKEIILKQKMKEILKNNPSIKIISYIKYNEIEQSFIFYNSFKYQKIQKIYNPENCERLWKLLPKDKLNIIQEKDIIKLGYISLKFDKIYFSNKSNENQNFIPSSENLENINIISEKNLKINSKNNFCRLCYQKGGQDPLICACRCTDSMKYVHLSCLKNKINSNIYMKHYKYHDIYLFQNYNCDICLETYPKYLIIDNNRINLINIDVSNYTNYIICDMIKFDEKKEYIFHIGYIVLHFENEVNIKIGRKKDNDIIFNDLSISGNHCELICKNNEIYIKDLDSKYGCLKYIQNKIEINPELNNELDIFISGNTKFEVNLIKNETIFNIECLSFFRNLFDNKCCGNNFNDKGDVDVNNNIKEENINEDNKESTEENFKIKYFEKFEDYDSYNDYIINMDDDKYL